MSIIPWVITGALIGIVAGYFLSERAETPSKEGRLLGIVVGLAVGMWVPLLISTGYSRLDLSALGDSSRNWPAAKVERTEGKVNITFPSESRPKINPDNPQGLIDSVLEAKGLEPVERPPDRGTWYWRWTWENYSAKGRNGDLHADDETCSGWTGEYLCLEAIQFEKEPKQEPSKEPKEADGKAEAEEQEEGRYGSDYDMTKAECRGDIECWNHEHNVDAGVACKGAIESKAKFNFKWIDTWGIGNPQFKKYGWADKEQGNIAYYGDDIKFKNKLGNWMRVRYKCVYDPSSDSVQKVVVEAGRYN